MRNRNNKYDENIKNRKYKTIIIFLTISIAICSILLISTFIPLEKKSTNFLSSGEIYNSEKGEVVKIISEVEGHSDLIHKDAKTITQKIKIKITKGAHINEIIEVKNVYNKQFPYSHLLKEGDNIFISIEEDDNGNITNAYVLEYVKDKYILYLVLFFIFIMIIIGGIKGVKALLTLVITAVGALKIIPYYIIKGYNPMLVSITVAILIVLITFFIVSGINKKSICAVLGTFGGVLVAGIISLIFGNLCRITGYGSEEIEMLMYIPQKTPFDFKGILFAGIILGALGAVMDVSMSISSSMNEICEANPKIHSIELMKAGMSVGRDIMGTMSNTLILAYVGASIQLIILLNAYQISFIEIINQDIMASEIIRALAGSIGLIFSIPITVVTSTMLREKYK